uniref:non-ribosomal peptide synthetase n=1 Tax=Variovorax atrisoli TaxID=3394203 RepID=UPI000369A9F0
HEAFFRQMLADVDEPTAPFNLLDVQGDGTRVEEARLRLDAQLAQEIRREAQRHGVSAATLFHLAWALVLGKATGKDDVVFGTVLFGRMQGGEGAQRALGLFINTLPLRVRLGAREIQACVKETHQALTQLLHHEHANLSLAQRCSALPGGTPLFSALLNYRYSPEPEVIEGQDAVPMWEGMDDLGGQERTNYPFGMSVDDLGKDFELVAQIHEAVSAQRICGFMRMAIDGIVAALEKHPAQPIRELDVIFDAERSQLTAWGSQHQSQESSVGDPIHSRIEREAAQHPDATALVFGDESLSYGELNAKANRLAHRLIALGVKPESRVGIAVERSIEMVVGILAVLKAGGAYVPLDPEYPADRLSYMVQDSGIELLLTQSHLGALPGAESLQVLPLDTLDTASEPDGNPQVALHGENLAYVIYTSGSTGRPKGAQLCHRNVTRLLDATQHWFGFSPDDVWTMFHSYAFDFSVWEIFGALCAGGKLVVVPFWVSRSPEDFLQLLRAQRVSILNQTPSAFGQLVALPQALEGGLSLRAVIFGGEALDPQRLRPWIERYGDGSPQLINMYGITETTVHVTYRRITRADLGQQRSPVGVAIPDLGMQVLDGQLGPVPQGVAGELYVSGEGLARGYLKRAALTAERFIATEKGQRLYRTGDLVRWNNEGQLEYLGRIDHQVKVRGFRIELGEIEAGLQAQEEVREAVVVANEGPAGTRLVAYVSGNAGQVIDTAALKQKLGEALPDYMVPSVIVELQALPLNANGKVDRKALPAPEFTSERAYEAPEGEVEEALAAIWAEVLAVARVGRNDNFFELGGDSIISLKLIARIRESVPGGSWLSLIDVMQSGSLRDLAARLRQKFEQEHNAVCFNATGSGTPLYCLPGLMVNSREFLPLAQALQDDRPVYGFACHVFTRKRWRGFDVQAIAAEYADFISATALQGRCALLGWSSGGDLAFEVVRQLQGRVEIEFVGMVDVFENTALRATRTLTDVQRRQAEEALAAWLARSQMADRWHELLARMGGSERAYVLEEMLFAGREFPLDGPGEESLECEMWIRLDKRLRAEQCAYDRIDVPMHVFLADASLQERGVLRNWSDSAPVLSSEIVPDADHLSIIRHPQMLASLRQHLARTEVLA